MKLILTHNQRAAMVGDLVAGWFQRGDRVLNLGVGEGYITRHLQTLGCRVTPVDVRDTSRFPEITPILYDGLHLPFAASSFEVCLLSTVLHHTPQPELVINEAMRVAQRLIIIEDIYRTRVGRWVVIASCSLANKQFHNHPHTNKSDTGWRSTFTRLGLTLLTARYLRIFFVVYPIFHGAYLVERLHSIPA